MENLQKDDLAKLKGKAGVYLIMCNEYMYVGSSCNLYRRLKRHLRDLKVGEHHNVFLQRVVNEYGLPFVNLFLLEECSNYIERESFYIREFNPQVNFERDPISRVKSQVTKDKISNWMKGRNTGASNPSARAVHKYSLLGLYLESYPTIREAAKTHYISTSSIQNCADKRTKSAGSFIWSFRKSLTVKPRVIERKPRIFRRLIQKTSSGKRVTWKKVSDLSDHLGVSIQAVYKAIKDGTPCKGNTIQLN